MRLTVAIVYISAHLNVNISQSLYCSLVSAMLWSAGDGAEFNRCPTTARYLGGALFDRVQMESQISCWYVVCVHARLRLRAFVRACVQFFFARNRCVCKRERVCVRERAVRVFEYTHTSTHIHTR